MRQERCQHPTWTMTDAPTLEQTGVFHIQMTFDYIFQPDKGAQPTATEIEDLLVATESYIRKVLHEDPLFGSLWSGTLELSNVVDTYFEYDVWQLQVLTAVHFQQADRRSRLISPERANQIIARGRNLNDYVTNYVRYMGRVRRNLFYYVQNVKYRGVAHSIESQHG